MHFDFDIYSWIILPIIIMLSRIADVTLGTMRIILISKGHRKIAPFVGFCEVMIWLFVMSQIIKHIDNVACYLAWGVGFATGIFVGSTIEEKIALGIIIFRIMISENAEQLIKNLREEKYGITSVDASGAKGPVKIIYIITQRKNQKKVAKIIHAFSPEILYSIEDLKTAHENLVTSKSMQGYNKAKIGKWK